METAHLCVRRNWGKWCKRTGHPKCVNQKGVEPQNSNEPLGGENSKIAFNSVCVCVCARSLARFLNQLQLVIKSTTCDAIRNAKQEGGQMKTYFIIVMN